MTLSTDPLHIAVSKSRGLKIDWADGHASDYPVAWLRDECPCATCTGAHGTTPQKTTYSLPETPDPANPFPMFKPRLKMDHIEEVGSYAVRIDWNDGHNAGLYSYDYLRRICPCPSCAQARAEGTL